MKNNPKNVSAPVIVILYLLAAVFLGYGIYMAYDAVVYVNTYDTNEAVSSTNMLQYVVAASASYFGFAIVIFAAASILGALNKVQRNLYQASAPDANTIDIPAKAVAEEISVDAAGSDTTTEEKSEKAPEPDAGIPLSSVEEPAESPQPDQSNDEDTAPEEEKKLPKTDNTVNADEPPAEPQEAPAVTEPEIEEKPEEASAPLVEDFSSQFITEKEQKPAPEITANPSEPEIVAQQETPEIIAQQQPTPEIVVKRQPVTKALPQENIPQKQAAPEITAEKPAAKPQPTTIPEEILQTKRKRGLKYETVAMDGKKSDSGYPQSLSDTIRLKKEDRDAISSAFIRDIFEKNE